jgi:hypothetical protein
MIARVLRFLRLCLAVLFPELIPASALASALEMNGGIPNDGGLIAYLAQLAANGSHPFVGIGNYQALANASGQTWNAANVPGGIAGTVLLRSGAAGVSDTTDTALNIVAAMPNAYVGQTALFILANTNTGTLTVVAGTNVTLAGTTTAITVACRFYLLKVTNLNVPGAPGAAATNTTTTSAAVASVPGATSVVVPVTANTGMIVGSALQWTDAKGFLQSGPVTAVNSNNITVGNANVNGIASGVTVTAWNTTVTLQGMFQIGANIAA